MLVAVVLALLLGLCSGEGTHRQVTPEAAPPAGMGPRCARSGGGAPWRAAGQGGTERPASPLGTPTPTPPPAKLELGIVSRSSGEACFCVGIPRSWGLLQLAARAQFRNPGRAPGRGGAC